MQSRWSSKKTVAILGVTLALVALTSVALFRRQPREPLNPADQKYREVIIRAIREGKREFSAPTATRVQIIVQSAQEAGFKVSTEKLGEGGRVYLIKP